ncbi:MAG: hypothetical protein COX65_10050 [Elusimicrobia bacterium CG_4_10_14_0_2_um_filter_56_8]|nr:MAG: hypothetical protein AUJ51_13330 [Elusimicrobia bacterium CG1_02_56_21]PJA11631.1 MAG: hypothetical protein COX65_10050 [Elusimicrobia bacterium CG_4_10_14_0_2_um_filter_56_8]
MAPAGCRGELISAAGNIGTGSTCANCRNFRFYISAPGMNKTRRQLAQPRGSHVFQQDWKVAAVRTGRLNG